MTLHEEKARLRAQLKQMRNELAPDEIIKKSQQIYKNLEKIDAWSGAGSVFCYISYLSEVNTRPMLENFLERNLRIAVPKIVDKTTMLAIPFAGWDELQPDRMGILTPTANEADPGPFDLVITPGLGFNRQGGRLGYGRGYYDRWFDQHQVKTRIGVCFELQLVDGLPLEETDVPLQVLVTEQQVYDFRD
ncbi:MAG: 5-formyltetrahydrofolate cyclo-ligase [Gammaproteobacteria bacterium]